MKRARVFLAGLMPAGLAGAFFALTILAKEPGASRIGLLLAGWLLGVAIVALIRLFKVAPWAYPLAGLVCGPVPVALITWSSAEPEEWFGVWLLCALLGALIGTLELARLRHGAPAD